MGVRRALKADGGLREEEAKMEWNTKLYFFSHLKINLRRNDVQHGFISMQ